MGPCWFGGEFEVGTLHTNLIVEDLYLLAKFSSRIVAGGDMGGVLADIGAVRLMEFDQVAGGDAFEFVLWRDGAGDGGIELRGAPEKDGTGDE